MIQWQPWHSYSGKSSGVDGQLDTPAVHSDFRDFDFEFYMTDPAAELPAKIIDLAAKTWRKGGVYVCQPDDDLYGVHTAIIPSAHEILRALDRLGVQHA